MPLFIDLIIITNSFPLNRKSELVVRITSSQPGVYQVCLHNTGDAKYHSSDCFFSRPLHSVFRISKLSRWPVEVTDNVTESLRTLSNPTNWLKRGKTRVNDQVAIGLSSASDWSRS